MATVGGVVLGTGTASAASACTSNSQRGLCLAVDRNADGTYRVHVGVDVHMPIAQAQEYIDDPGDPFVVIIVGDDGSGSDPSHGVPSTFSPFLSNIPMTFVSASNERGLSASFDMTVPGSVLNEDPPGQEDEIRAYVQLWDRDTNRMITHYLTNQLSGNWS